MPSRQSSRERRHAMFRVDALYCLCLMFGLAIVRAEHPPTNDPAPQPTKQFSKPVHASGVEFEVAAEPLWHRPAKIYGVGHALISLRITNRSNQDLTFDLGDHLFVSLRGTNDTEHVLCAVPQKFVPQTLKVAAGKNETVTLATELVHTRIAKCASDCEATRVGTGSRTICSRESIA